jgi:hypothetical protein
LKWRFLFFAALCGGDGPLFCRGSWRCRRGGDGGAVMAEVMTVHVDDGDDEMAVMMYDDGWG